MIKWQQVLFPQSSDSDKWFTEYIVSKTELLVKHIEAFREELAVVSAMEQDLEQLLAQQLNFINRKKTEAV